MSAARIQWDVADEIRGLVRIVSPAAFIEHILRSGCDTKLIEEEVKEKHYDVKNQRWRGFRARYRRELTEKQLSRSLVRIANTVNTECAPYCHKDSVQGEWLDTHSIALKLRINDCAAARPGIVYVSRREDMEELQLKLLRDDSDEPSDEQEERRKNLQRVWWLHVHACIEVKPKPKNEEELHTHIVQLCSYMRQMFQEQLDRRFVIGLLLCGSHLTMWLCDRSGLIGTVEPINIHDEPVIFVKILSSFALLPSFHIGWDPTMMIYQSPRKRLPSYLAPADPTRDRFEPALYHVNWVISMPVEGHNSDDPGDGREEFITIRAIDVPSSQKIFSRATVVWEVVKLKEYETNLGDDKEQDSQVFILKQTWQAVHTSTAAGGMVDEAMMYRKAGFNNFLSADSVKIQGEFDITSCIRNGLSVSTYDHVIAQWEKENSKSGSQQRRLLPVQSRKVRRCKEDEPFLYVRLARTCLNIFVAISDDVVPCSHARLLLRESGCEIKYFADLVELIQAFLDSVEDHKRLCDGGILHRDVSFGNILIRVGPVEKIQQANPDTKDQNADGNSGSVVPAEKSRRTGFLIDLDHAKEAQGTVNPYAHDPPSDSELVRLRDYLPFTIDTEVLILAWRYFGNTAKVICYLSALYEDLQRSTDPNLRELTEDDLKWPKLSEATTSLYDFSIREERKGLPNRMGTIPYMSVEVLCCELSFGPSLSPEGVVNGRGRTFFHDIVHDMESFLWVMVHICLTRGGPMGQRRQPDPEIKERLTQTLNTLFDNDNVRRLGHYRLRYIHYPRQFQDEILSLFDPHFEPLKELVVNWLRTLCHAYRHRAVEYHEIHNIVMKLLQETLERLRTAVDREKSNKVKESRYRRWINLRKFPKVLGGEVPTDENSSATVCYSEGQEIRALSGSMAVVPQQKPVVRPIKIYQTRARSHRELVAATQPPPSSPSENRVASQSVLAGHQKIFSSYQARPPTAPSSRRGPSVGAHSIPPPSAVSRQYQLLALGVRRRNSSSSEAYGACNDGPVRKRSRLG